MRQHVIPGICTISITEDTILMERHLAVIRQHIVILGNYVKGCFAEERGLTVFILINDEFEFHVLTQSGSIKTHGNVNVSLAAGNRLTVAHDVAH